MYLGEAQKENMALIGTDFGSSLQDLTMWSDMPSNSACLPSTSPVSYFRGESSHMLQACLLSSDKSAVGRVQTTPTYLLGYHVMDGYVHDR